MWTLLNPVQELTSQWAERRVFYCTPQTLDNDLKSGAVDPRDIVLAVFGQLNAQISVCDG